MKLRLLALMCLLAVAMAVDNGLGLTPQMGWNSWNKFGCNINETLIRKTADLLVSTGLAAKGYQYLNLDDCWQVDSLLIIDRQKLNYQGNLRGQRKISFRDSCAG